MKRFLILLLALSMLLAAFASCRNSDTKQPDDKKQPDEQQPVDENPSTSDTKLPDTVWKKELKVLDTDEGGTIQYATTSVFAEEPSDTYSSMVCERNALLEDKYGIFITENRQKDPSTDLIMEYQLSDSSYDLAFVKVHTVKPLMAYGLIMANLYDTSKVPYLDLENDCWNDYVNETLSIKNRLYFTTGYLNIEEKANTALIYYNRDMVEANDMQNPAELVKSGDWTLEAMAKYVKDGTQRDDSTGKTNVYGLSLSSTRSFFNYLSACGVRICSKDNDDVPYFSLANDKTTAAKTNDVIDKVLAITNGEGGTKFARYSRDIENMKGYFIDRRALFFDDVLSFVDTAQDKCDFDYGFLPYPKYDTNQTEYYSNVHSHFSALIGIPAFAEDTAFSSFALQAMCENSEDLMEYYYETNCMMQGSVDAEQYEMIHYATENPVYDLGVVYGWGAVHVWIFVDYSDKFASIPVGGVNNFTTSWASCKDLAEAELQRFLDYIK